MKRKIRNLVRKILPFVLVGIITSSAVMLSYNECRDVKAVAVVDDVVLVTALLAMCGVAWIGTEYTWSNGDWGTDGSSALDWGNGFDDTWEKQWDKDVKEQGQILGYLDENGYITGGGGSGSDPDNNDNKFPSWEELKQKIAENSGNIASVLTALTPFVALYSYDALKQSGADLADRFIQTFPNVDLEYFNKNTKVVIQSSRSITPYNNDSGFAIIECNFPIAFCDNRIVVPKKRGTFVVKEHFYFFRTDGSLLMNDTTGFYGGITTMDNCYVYDMLRVKKSDIHTSAPIFSDIHSALDYVNSQMTGTGLSEFTTKSKYFNSDNISMSSNLKTALRNTDDLPQLPLNTDTGYLRLPSNSELSQYFQALKNASTSAEKDSLVNGFIDKITNPDLNPEPEPKPEPKPEPEPEPEPKPNEDNADLLADLKHLFPFCVPFDLVDCFKLFNAEPVTPRVEFPIHFGIVEKDYTFIIDLEDFNGVAKVCRLMFLIGFIVSLVYATRQLIRG